MLLIRIQISIISVVAFHIVGILPLADLLLWTTPIQIPSPDSNQNPPAGRGQISSQRSVFDTNTTSITHSLTLMGILHGLLYHIVVNLLWGCFNTGLGLVKKFGMVGYKGVSWLWMKGKEYLRVDLENPLW